MDYYDFAPNKKKGNKQMTRFTQCPFIDCKSAFLKQDCLLFDLTSSHSVAWRCIGNWFTGWLVCFMIACCDGVWFIIRLISIVQLEPKVKLTHTDTNQ